MSKPEKTGDNRRRSILQFVVPAVVSVLSLIVIYLYVLLPRVQQGMFESRKQEIKNMVTNTISILDSYKQLVDDSIATQTGAERLAVHTIGNLRYGPQNHDYFWIVDIEGNVISHPYINEVDVEHFSDSLGNFPVSTMKKIAHEKGKGYFNYLFYQNGDTSRQELKTSYVELYKPWNWVVGTGFYVVDLEDELKTMKKDALWVLLAIVLILSVLLLVIVQRSFKNAHLIHEREQNLLITQSRFKGFSNSIEAGLVIIEDYRITFANKRFFQIFNFEPNRLEQFAFDEYLIGNDLREISNILFSTEITDKKNVNYDIWAQIDLEQKFLNFDISYEQRGKTIIAYVLISDETERHKDAIKIRQLSQAIAQSPTSILITDIKGVIEYVNPGFEKITGYTSQEVLGKKPGLFKSDKMPEAVYADLWNTILAGETWENELINKTKNGDLIWLTTIISPIVDNDGKIINFVEVQMDITARKNIENELINAKEKAEVGERLKSAFITNVSHEVRTPLNAIHGFAQLFKAVLPPDDKNYEYAQLIENNSKVLLKLFEDILEYSKIESNTLELKTESVDVNKLLSKLASKYNTKNISLHNKPIEIILDQELLDKTMLLDLDKVYFTKIIDSLVFNALKFTNEGVIKVGYFIRKDEIEFFVSDTGIGILESDKRIIFDAFAHGTKQFVTLHRGTGLGLSITKRLVKLMGGKLWFDTQEDKGTSFHFTIPASKIITEKYVSQLDTLVNKLKGKKILVAEDNQHSFLLLQALMNLLHVKVIHALDGNEAVDFFDKEKDIAIVLMDIMMPHMDGIKATRIIKNSNKKIPVVALTAIEDKGLGNDKHNFDGFIRKPVQKTKLFQVMESLLVNGNP